MWWLVTLLPVLVMFSGCGGVLISLADNKDRRTPLERAAQDGDANEVRRLLASGADPNDKGGVFGCSLCAAATHRENAEVIRTLLAAGAHPNGRKPEGGVCWSPALWTAATWGDTGNTRALLDAGASIEPSTCSKLVAGWLQPAIVDLLVQRGLDLNAVDENGKNQLHLSLAPPMVPPYDAIEYLVRSKVSLNARDHSGKTPLAYWREPRHHEVHWFSTWLIDRLSGESSRTERENRAKISALLERSGAVL